MLALGACAHHYAVEQRDTPVHVWVSAPELGRAGGSVEALIYVGSQKAVEGTLQFPAGTSTVILPTMRTTEGSAHVQAVFAGGAVTVSEDVRVRGDTWIQITLTGRTATIRATAEQPPIPR